MSGQPQSGAGRGRRRRRTALVAGAALATLAVAGAATLGFGGRGEDAPDPERGGPAGTATVTRQTLVKAGTLTGTLGYGRATPLACTATGTVTWLPEVGAIVNRGGVLLRADERPVVLMYGSLPMYRQLGTDTEGSDVRQFERNLAALGYSGFTVDETYSAGTASAVKRWQRDLGLPESGTVERERVVYAPESIRVAERLVRLGAAATGDVLSYTGRTRSVTVAAEPGEAGWAAKGTRVTVKLPTGTSVPGKVSAVGAPAAGASGGASAGSEQSADAAAGAVEVTIGVADQKALGTLSGGSVAVRYVEQERKDVLTVPVDALLALAEGGYGLEVVEGGRTRIVPVEPGLFAEGRVEVTGAGLTEGATVGVPA